MGIAIIGTGFISSVHAEALKQLGKSIDLVIGTETSKAKAFAERWDIKNYSIDFNEALSNDINSIHICTPPLLHYEMAKEVIKNNKHIICEKPMCLDPLEAKELMEMAKEKNLVNAVNFNVRFHDNCREAKDMIKSEELGEIFLIHGSYLQEFHALPAEYMWRYNSHLAGPMRATTEIGSHWIDLSRYLTGLEISSVSANFGKFNSTRYLSDSMMHAEELDNSQEINVDSDDAAVVSLRYSNGAIGSMLLSEVSHGRNNRLSIEITGQNKSIWWNSENPYTLNSSTKFNGVTKKVNAFGGGFPNTFKEFFQNVYEDIDKGYPSNAPEYPTFYDGYINSAVCDAIYRSANNNSEWMEV